MQGRPSATQSSMNPLGVLRASFFDFHINPKVYALIEMEKGLITPE